MATRLPPGPRGTQAIITQLAMLRDPLQCFSQLARDYGDVVSFRIGAQRAILLSGPGLIDRVVRDRQFVRSEETRRGLSSLLGQGLLSLEGSTHLRHRRLMQPAFLASASNAT
jgi:cytochrome P450